MPSTRSRNSLTPTSVHHADIMAEPASTVSAPTEMVAMDEDMRPGHQYVKCWVVRAKVSLEPFARWL